MNDLPDWFDENLFDRSGKPITFDEYANLLSIVDYKVVQQDTITDMFGTTYFISTVWLGMNHNWSDEGPPLIFETMVFLERKDDRLGPDLYQARYATEEEALAGHQQAVDLFIFIREEMETPNPE